MATYLFPGQGSQYKGMGENLFDRFPEIGPGRVLTGLLRHNR